MLELIETPEGWNVIDEEGNVLNPEPFESEEQAEEFRMQVMSEEQAISAGVGAPKASAPNLPPQMPMPPMGGGNPMEKLLGGM